MESGKLDSKELINLCRKMRLHALDMALAAGRRGAHLSGSLSCIEIYAVLYGSILKYNVSNPRWEGRDRFIAGKEHARLAEFIMYMFFWEMQNVMKVLFGKLSLQPDIINWII